MENDDAPLHQRDRANDAHVDALLGDVLPVDELDGTVGALLGATTAADALRGEVRLSMSMRGMFHGHACDMPQPMHMSLSTMRAPFSSLT